MRANRLRPQHERAAEFALAFYSRVLEGEMIGEAVRLARIEVQKALADGITWASFMLHATRHSACSASRGHGCSPRILSGL
jgi:hypothetical protein